VKHRLKVSCIPRQEATTSILEQDLTLIGGCGRRRCHALFDSGASYSIVRRDIAEEVSHLEPLPDPENWEFETAEPGALVQARYRINVNFRFDDSEANFSDEFIVFDNCTEEVIIGVKTMQAWHIGLDFESERIHYRKSAQRLRV
jgi:hypothetical protein